MNQLESIIEALLFCSERPLSVKTLTQLVNNDVGAGLEEISEADVLSALSTLTSTYQQRGIVLKTLASGYQFEANASTTPWVHAMLQRKPPRYSKSLLETLAVIAYRQPVTRGDIEGVRGVAVSSSIIKTLLEHGWIKISGCRDLPGKPALYVTTPHFLDHFGLKQLSELPTLTAETDPKDLLTLAVVQKDSEEVVS